MVIYAKIGTLTVASIHICSKFLDKCSNFDQLQVYTSSNAASEALNPVNTLEITSLSLA